MDDEDGGLLSIALSDSDSDQQACASSTKASRTGQTEEEYQAVKRSYRVKVENGNVSPIPPTTVAHRNARKSESLSLVRP
jgi:hypothetical protein